MPDALLVLFSFVLGAMRSLAFGIQAPNKPRAGRTIPAHAEQQVLLIAIFCLTGLLVSLGLVSLFPELGATIAEMNLF